MSRSEITESGGLHATPAPLALGSGVLNAVIAASAVLGVVAASLNKPPALYMIAFEAVILASCLATLIYVGRGAPRPGPALAMCAAAGTVLVGSVLGHLSVQGRLHGVSLEWFRGLRVLGALALAALAAATVLVRRPGVAVPMLLKGLACGTIAVGIALAAYFVSNSRAVSLPAVLQIVLGSVALILLLGFLAAGIHMVIRAFELTAERT